MHAVAATNSEFQHKHARNNSSAPSHHRCSNLTKQPLARKLFVTLRWQISRKKNATEITSSKASSHFATVLRTDSKCWNALAGSRCKQTQVRVKSSDFGSASFVAQNTKFVAWAFSTYCGLRGTDGRDSIFCSHHFTACTSSSISAWPSTISFSSRQDVRHERSGIASSVSSVFPEWELPQLTPRPLFRGIPLRVLHVSCKS